MTFFACRKVNKIIASCFASLRLVVFLFLFSSFFFVIFRKKKIKLRKSRISMRRLHFQVVIDDLRFSTNIQIYGNQNKFYKVYRALSRFLLNIILTLPVFDVICFYIYFFNFVIIQNTFTLLKQIKTHLYNYQILVYINVAIIMFLLTKDFVTEIIVSIFLVSILLQTFLPFLLNFSWNLIK